MNAVIASTPSFEAAFARRTKHGSSGVVFERTRGGWRPGTWPVLEGRPRDHHPDAELVLPDGTAAARATQLGDPGG